MTDQPLGRLECVELRDIWISEATSFTPWLARPENITVLDEALNIDLELEAQERLVGRSARTGVQSAAIQNVWNRIYIAWITTARSAALRCMNPVSARVPSSLGILARGHRHDGVWI